AVAADHGAGTPGADADGVGVGVVARHDRAGAADGGAGALAVKVFPVTSASVPWAYRPLLWPLNVELATVARSLDGPTYTPMERLREASRWRSVRSSLSEPSWTTRPLAPPVSPRCSTVTPSAPLTSIA